MGIGFVPRRRVRAARTSLLPFEAAFQCVLVALLACFVTTANAGKTNSSQYSFTQIDFPGAIDTWPSGINAAGQVVGYFDGADQPHGFIYSGGTFTEIPDVPGAVQTYASGINAAGQIVGSFVTDVIDPDTNHFSETTHGFLYSAGIFTQIDVPGSVETGVAGINAAGEMTGLFLDDHYVTLSFLYSRGAFTQIVVPFSADDEIGAQGINACPDVVGYFESHGFLLSGGTFTQLDFPGATDTRARGISDTGQIVGEFDDANRNTHGFLYSGGTFTQIDVPGSPMTEAFGINSAGQIVGDFYDQAGYGHGFLATPKSKTKAASVKAAGVQCPLPLSITTSSLPDGKSGKKYSQDVGAIGGKPPYTWSIAAGALPDKLALTRSAQAASISIAGTPTAIGTFNFTIEVRDSVGGTVTQPLSIAVSCGPPTLGPVTVGLPVHQVPDPLNPQHMVTASGYFFGIELVTPSQCSLAGSQVSEAIRSGTTNCPNLGLPGLALTPITVKQIAGMAIWYIDDAVALAPGLHGSCNVTSYQDLTWISADGTEVDSIGTSIHTLNLKFPKKGRPGQPTIQACWNGACGVTNYVAAP